MFIIASVKNDTSSENIVKMILAGANMLRLNLTYYKIDEIITYLKNIQEAAEKINSKTEILIDLPINKIRLGDFNNKILSPLF